MQGNAELQKKNDTTSQTVTGFFLSDVHVHVYEKKCIKKKLKSFITINVETQ